jgi:hypothetical protein
MSLLVIIVGWWVAYYLVSKFVYQLSTGKHFNPFSGFWILCGFVVLVLILGWCAEHRLIHSDSDPLGHDDAPLYRE